MYNVQMTQTMTFDTLRLAEGFKKAGFNEKQSKELADKFGSLANDHAITREYLDFKLRELQLKMTINLAVTVTAVIAFFKIFDKFFQ